MKTIRQIAEEIGVTKQAVFYRIKNPPLSNALHSLMTKENGILMISLDGETLIKQAFQTDSAKTFDDKNASNENASFGVMFEMLRRELETKNEQLTEKDKQIASLTTLLEQTTSNLHAAQFLHGSTMQQQLTDGSEKLEKPKSFFARLFGNDRKG